MATRTPHPPRLRVAIPHFFVSTQPLDIIYRIFPSILTGLGKRGYVPGKLGGGKDGL